MELRELAGRILFATTLEEKLQCPESVTDEHPGRALTAPAAPGRPAGLQFKPSGTGKSAFPGRHRLDRAPERGRLLHYFANHELLATELMALVLLRFPDAPRPFRRGVLQTLRDEQAHTRLYLERMRACGITFGELPVSGYFWRCLAPMAHPIDYVAGLSLTFEQANLDYSRHFAQGFAAVGDAATAALLERIHRDEIGHVAYGLKWFRRWKQPGTSDWEAFCRQLKFPLSPQRAKGVRVEVAPRLAAGFDADFIARLDVHAQSKGRTPNVYLFNPFAESRIAHGRAFHPVQEQVQLAADLANLPQFLCRQDDLVLVESRPAQPFLGALRQSGFDLPEFVEWKQLADLSGRKLGHLRPWAWAPDSVECLAPLFPQAAADQRPAAKCFNPAIARLYSKAGSADRLRQFLAHVQNGEDAACAEWLCTPDEAGVAVSSVPDALAAIAAIRSRGHHRVLIKEALGLAGRNAIRLWEPALLKNQRRWIERALGHGRELVIEPWLERELDYSVQLELTPRDLKLCGYTGLFNDPGGQFKANWAGPRHARRLPSRVAQLLAGAGNPARAAELEPTLSRLHAELFALIEAGLREAGHFGPVGLDAFVYRAPDGRCRLKPVVEINPRYTMGRVTVELMKHTTPGSHGRFELVNRATLRRAGCADFAAYARVLAERFPLELAGEPQPRLHAGALCLNDPAAARACLAVFRVGRTLDSVLSD